MANITDFKAIALLGMRDKPGILSTGLRHLQVEKRVIIVRVSWDKLPLELTLVLHLLLPKHLVLNPHLFLDHKLIILIVILIKLRHQHFLLVFQIAKALCLNSC